MRARLSGTPQWLLRLPSWWRRSRRARDSARRQRFLDAGLADAAGDGDDLAPSVRARAARAEGVERLACRRRSGGGAFPGASAGHRSTMAAVAPLVRAAATSRARHGFGPRARRTDRRADGAAVDGDASAPPGRRSAARRWRRPRRRRSRGRVRHRAASKPRKACARLRYRRTAESCRRRSDPPHGPCRRCTRTSPGRSSRMRAAIASAPVADFVARRAGGHDRAADRVQPVRCADCRR